MGMRLSRRIQDAQNTTAMPADPFSHINRLEDEAIHIIREAVAEAERPVLLY